jgi:hypothetical protein
VDDEPGQLAAGFHGFINPHGEGHQRYRPEPVIPGPVKPPERPEPFERSWPNLCPQPVQEILVCLVRALAADVEPVNQNDDAIIGEPAEFAPGEHAAIDRAAPWPGPHGQFAEFQCGSPPRALDDGRQVPGQPGEEPTQDEGASANSSRVGQVIRHCVVHSEP